MAEVLVKLESKAGGGDVGLTDDRLGGGGGGGPSSFNSAQIGLWMTLGTLSMLFAAFTSAYLVRSTAADWAPIALPPLLWVNTAVLLLSSVTMEQARRAFRRWKPVAFRKWLVVTFFFGGAFLAGQLLAWRQLAAQGIFLHSNPHSSFFYVLTGIHALHLVAGVLALFYTLVQSWRYRLTPETSSAPGLCATYWHFVDVVWIYLFVVLFVW